MSLAYPVNPPTTKGGSEFANSIFILVILWLTEEALRFLLATSIGRTLALSRTLITITDCEEEEMPKRKYAVERGGDKSLEI